MNSSLDEDIEATHEQILPSGSGLARPSEAFTILEESPRAARNDHNFAAKYAKSMFGSGSLEVPPSDCDSSIVREHDASLFSAGFQAPALPRVKLKTPPRAAVSAGISQDTPKGVFWYQRLASAGWAGDEGFNNDSTLVKGLSGRFQMSQDFAGSLCGALKPGYPNNFRLHVQQAQSLDRKGSSSTGSGTEEILGGLLSSPCASQTVAIKEGDLASEKTGSIEDCERLNSSTPFRTNSCFATNRPTAVKGYAEHRPARNTSKRSTRFCTTKSHDNTGLDPRIRSSPDTQSAPDLKADLRSGTCQASADASLRSDVRRTRHASRELREYCSRKTQVDRDPPRKSRASKEVTGCWTCKLRRKKCDMVKPVCEACARLKIDCMGYGPAGFQPDFMKNRRKNRAMRAHIAEQVAKTLGEGDTGV